MTITPAIATDGTGTRSDATIRAIRTAAARTGVDFAFLLAQAAMESGFDPRAQAATSSARGLYQFTDATWLAMVRDHGASVGLAAYAAKIATDDDGRADVADAAMRDRLLALRDDPRLSAELAARLAQDNRVAMEASLGAGGVGATELYLAHFLGAGQAGRFLAALRTTPEAAAADLFPTEAKANRGVFHDTRGQARSLAEVYDRFDRRLAKAVRDVDPGSFAVALGGDGARPSQATTSSRSVAWRPGQRYGAPLDPLVILVLASLDAPDRARSKQPNAAARA